MPNNIPYDQPTMPNPALQPRRKSAQQVQHPVPQQMPIPPRQQAATSQLRKPPKKKQSYRWAWVLLTVFVGLFFTFVGTIVLGVMLVYSNGILPAVSVSGVALGGMSEEEAVAELSREWDHIILRDGDRTWTVNPGALGITMDAQGTAARAYAMGRTSGNPIKALIGGVQVSPIVTVNEDVASAELTRISEQINIPPIDAGVAFTNGQVTATPPQNGRSLDVNKTIQQFASTIQSGTSQGEIDLVMVEIAPALSDASGIVSQAKALLSNPLEIRVFDAVTGDSVFWSAMPQEWSQWLSVTSDPNSAIGLSLDANPDAVRAFLTNQANSVLDATRTLEIDAGVESVVNAIRRGDPSQGFVQVKHKQRLHTVQAGETITSISWDYGIPYLYIQQLNNGVEVLSAGQQILIPPADVFLTEPANPNKRIVVSISQQNVKVYENNQLKWDWVASTGIADSPTWTGVYQVQSHVDNAYAANWNLHMPNFMGVYQPVPGADFTNGFHGFPTRGGGQLLWGKQPRTQSDLWLYSAE